VLILAALIATGLTLSGSPTNAGFVTMRQSHGIVRDDFGVPIIKASSAAEAWRAAGYAVAQDRLWQMEMSRRTVRGRLAEVLGPSALPSDQEVRKTAYTQEELEAQFNALPADLKESFTGYAQGVNDFIAEGKLPGKFAEVGIQPEPWTEIDSVAISVWLFQYFGRGGAGALRNMAALAYLQTQKPIAGHVLDVLDDFIWQNDPTSPTTLAKEDEAPNHPMFAAPTRAITERQLAMLPKLSLFELLPGLSVASREKSTRLAQRVGAPFRTGSYCMVVGGKRSATGQPSLLSGPQMGFTAPSIVHEMAIEAPDLHVVGMDVPGIPGVLVGHTDHVAWGITSGVAATDDIVYAPKVAEHYYLNGDQRDLLQPIKTIIHVKGGKDVDSLQERVADGPVLMTSQPHGTQPAYVFARHSSYRNQELQSLAAIDGIWHANSAVEADLAAAKGTMSFNLFFADTAGHIGYRYCGLVPLRSNDLDPRLPTPEGPKYAWKGMIPPAQMPHVIDPKSGLLTNWNNKPASWWPNLDTPIWGKIFHVESIRRSLPDAPLSAQSLEFAAWKIARSDETWPYFGPYVMKEHAQAEIGGFDGLLMQGSRQAAVYRAFLAQLRKLLFYGTVGNFVSESLAQEIAQPSVMLAALQGRTKFNYLHGRTASQVVHEALKAAIAQVHGTYMPSQIPVPNEPPIPYANRGTYIQVVELLADGPLGRNVLPPGVAAEGSHSRDQAPLSRAWVYKPMPRPWKP
jgi:acyl-homoserine lactone acylase PvdQ